MKGMYKIAQRYQLKTHASAHHGIFDWKRRMGIHLAFHRSPTNIIIHALFSLINVWAILLMAYPFQIINLELFNTTITLAMVILALVFILYAFMDLGAAILITALYSLTYPLCEPIMNWLSNSTALMLVFGSVLTLLALAVQVYIGHNIFEQGIDDASENFDELFSSKNPILFAALPFYTYLDLFFMMGYRPKLAQFIWDMTRELRPKLEAELTQKKQ